MFDAVTDSAIAEIAKINSDNGKEQEIYVMEECAEFVEAYTKRARDKDTTAHLLEEAMDLICSSMVLLHRYGVDKNTLRQHILTKCNRAITRYARNGEL